MYINSLNPVFVLGLLCVIFPTTDSKNGQEVASNDGF